MEPKKTVRADLTRKSFLFFNIGLVTSLSLTIAAFTFKTKISDRKADLTNAHTYVDELIDVPVTEQRPPQPKLEQPQIVEVPDEKVIEENIVIDMDMETTETDVSSVLEPVKIEIEEEDPNTVFTIVEESAMPVGGMDAFYAYIAKTMLYPNQARRMQIEGKVYVEFVVEKDGSITGVRTLKGIGAGCDEEAVRVISAAPKWTPAKQRGRTVRQKMVLPVNFRMG